MVNADKVEAVRIKDLKDLDERHRETLKALVEEGVELEDGAVILHWNGTRFETITVVGNLYVPSVQARVAKILLDEQSESNVVALLQHLPDVFEP